MELRQIFGTSARRFSRFLGAQYLDWDRTVGIVGQRPCVLYGTAGRIIVDNTLQKIGILFIYKGFTQLFRWV